MNKNYFRKTLKSIWAYLFVFLLIYLFPNAPFAVDQEFFGNWDCINPGETRVGQLDISQETHNFSMTFTDGEAFQFVFHPMIMDKNQANLLLLTPDNNGHPVTLIKDGQNMIVEFYDLKLVPNLHCSRNHRGFSGH